MNEIKMRSLVKQLHSADPGTRYEVLGTLYELKGHDDLKIRVEMLKDMMKEAATSFPVRVDVWDNPSLGLVEFVCDYPMPEIIDEILLRFEGLDPDAKVRALECLLLTKDEGIFQEIHDKSVHLVTHEEVVLPVEELCEFPVLLKGIVDKTFDQLESPHYKYMYYDFITAINESGVEAGYKRARVLPLLLADYAKLRDEYLKYDKEYRSDYAYQSWKETYFQLRYRLNVLIGLMNFYYSEETECFLKEAVSFKDPRISTNAVVVAMNKNIPVQPDILQSLSNHVESAEMMYWELAEHNKEHLFPVSPKQPVLAKAHLFNHLVHLQDEEGEELHIFPENIQVVDFVDTVNSYGQQLRYYLMSFSHGDEVLAAWVGGYSLEEEDDSADMWEGTHTDLEPIQNRTIEEHKQHFLKKREEYARENEETVYYESSPSLSKGLWFFYAILISHWIRVFINGIDEEVYISIGFTLLGGILTLYELWKKKRSAVVIVGRELRKVTGEKKESIPLQEIKKVTYDKKQISVYNKENVLTMKFPLRWVEYGEFYYVMVERTGHLREQPYIEE
ncbi:hypothetical protein NQ095_07140 [Rossellomorea sp. SC111]|uniref:hypothetical protein n=1 Tax=Rossellomorea sp. SC111 TaxID=2968985 RepID=UPI00215AB39F|nr:hypothetical protein [Rossellomorea sp. SC111]MCR8848171.1 hypothetical protein [Rossellomorea sp. SC111]